MSSPHFYQADKKFADDILGMRPTKEQHQTAIDINPVCTCFTLLSPLVKMDKTGELHEGQCFFFWGGTETCNALFENQNATSRNLLATLNSFIYFDFKMIMFYF